MWDIKRSSSDWAKLSGFYPDFRGWGKEYAAFSVSVSHKEAVIAYIMNQREHHQRVRFEEEFKRIAERNGLQWGDYLLT